MSKKTDFKDTKIKIYFKVKKRKQRKGGILEVKILNLKKWYENCTFSYCTRDAKKKLHLV